MRSKCLATLALVPLLGACDGFFDVTNPGPLTNDQLNVAAAVPALVNGMSGDLSFALSRVVFTSSLAAGEQAHGGSYLWAGRMSRGLLDGEEEGPNIWGFMHRARWVAEDGAERIQTLLGSDAQTSAQLARAYLFAGFSNRLLGETVCESVIDGGAAGPSSLHFERAESQFTQAIQIARAAGSTQVELAALGGRASVRATLGRWAEAVTDASSVPTDFRFESVFSLNSGRENNYMFAETYNRLEASVYNTEWAQVHGDPRVQWDTLYDEGGAVRRGQDGLTPVFQQRKHPTQASNIALTRGEEMLLIRAEARLRDGDWQGAIDLMNTARAHVGLDPLSGESVEATWEHLQRERGAFLWLEARRLSDLRRWHAEGRNSFLDQRDGCFPISMDERMANPNL